MHDTLPLLNYSDFPAISRRKTEILQINIGLRCNQQCVHCHVNSSPKRTEKMDEATIAAVYDYVKNSDVHTLDITGGAPELHPQFRELVVKVRALDVKVIDRCNLTILSEPDQENLAEFLAEPDYLVLTLPDTPKTRHFINSDSLAMMKSSAVLINVGRGSIINEDDLVNALQQQQIAGAVLDVFETEPLPDDSLLWELPNVYVTPHVAAASFPQSPRTDSACCDRSFATCRTALSALPCASV